MVENVDMNIRKDKKMFLWVKSFATYLLPCMCLNNTCVSLNNANYDAELESVGKYLKTSENIRKTYEMFFV